MFCPLYRNSKFLPWLGGGGRPAGESYRRHGREKHSESDWSKGQTATSVFQAWTGEDESCGWCIWPLPAWDSVPYSSWRTWAWHHSYCKARWLQAARTHNSPCPCGNHCENTRLLILRLSLHCPCPSPTFHLHYWSPRGKCEILYVCAHLYVITNLIHSLKCI